VDQVSFDQTATSSYLPPIPVGPSPSQPKQTPTAKKAGEVGLPDLQMLSTGDGEINILQESAVKFKEIGTDLLDDASGAKVTIIEGRARGDPLKAVRMMYEQWIQECADHSWQKLTRCFRRVELNNLAKQIEQHFGHPPPSLSGENVSEWSSPSQKNGTEGQQGDMPPGDYHRAISGPQEDIPLASGLQKRKAKPNDDDNGSQEKMMFDSRVGKGPQGGISRGWWSMVFVLVVASLVILTVYFLF
jgi:hypothetical protein